MLEPIILWVDLTHCEHDSGCPSIGSLACRVHRVFGAQGLGEMIRSVQPRALCFEFDYPLSSELTLLSETKRNHSAIPIVMLTEPHSEQLAMWALRARVWNYFVKPVSAAEIVRSMMPLLREDGYKDWDRRAPRNFITPEHDILGRSRPLNLSRTERTIFKARAYIESHLHEKISERMVAQFCGLSTSCFSRTFNRINGLTFSAFLLQARTQRAMELLENEHAKVTEVCHEAGFSNLSHFSRTFRRLVGVSPTVYRHRLRERVINAVGAEAVCAGSDSTR